MELETVAISKLKPHPRNPRIHPDGAIDKLVRSIEEFGWTNPVLVSEDGFILAGHARVKAAQKAGIKEVPVLRLPLSGDKADAYLIADNKLQDETDWDFPALKDLLEDLDTGEFDIEITGFNELEIERLMTQFYLPKESEERTRKEIVKEEWEGMPEFEHRDLSALQTIYVHFASREDVETFSGLIGQTITDRTRSIWFPKADIERIVDKRYIDES